MAAIIIGIGVVVLHAFATVVVWWELRSRERRSIKRIERVRRQVLDAVGLLRGDLEDRGALRAAPPGARSLKVALGDEVVELPRETVEQIDRFASEMRWDRKQMVEEAIHHGLTGDEAPPDDEDKH